MNPTETPHFTASYKTTNGDLVIVNAWRGIQVVIPSTGNPIDATEWGQVVLTVRNDDAVAQLAFKQSEDVINIFRLLERAERVAHSRNEADDKPHPGWD